LTSNAGEAAGEALARRALLAVTPTPLEPLPRLGAYLDMEPGSLWIKRDDLTALAGGGNKVRKLEYLCHQAVAEGARALVTGGGPQSNHARMTAAAAARLGMECILVLAADPPAEASGNLLLDGLLGARLRWVGDLGNDELEAAIADEVDEVRRQGGAPFHITVGGSTPLGCLGYVRAAEEILQQRPDAELVVVATGSCGTQAGLAARLGHDRILGVRVGERPDLEVLVSTKAEDTAALAGLPTPQGECRIDHSQLGAGYAMPTAAAVEAIEVTARLEGVLLDPVYTGKAMAALFAGRRTGAIGPRTRTVFVHTGGTPALFADRYRELWPRP
jgi:L-cysteate sulfo-lyase